MQPLPDLFFSLTHLNGGTRLLNTTSDALDLPPALKVKWLRAECMQALDLTGAGDRWGISAWQRLAMCLHAVPSLQELTIKLPCVTAQEASARPWLVPVAAPQAAGKRTGKRSRRPLQGLLCSRCGTKKLHVHCGHCRCAIITPEHVDDASADSQGALRAYSQPCMCSPPREPCR